MPPAAAAYGRSHVGTRRLPPLRDHDDLELRARARRRLRHRPRRARARRRAGTGNVALRAAEAGADVVASDLEPAQLAAGRRAAEARGLDLAWVEADAAALPFPDASFDVVTSSAGAIFAPEQQAVADELVRVCRPGGTIGMINFTPGSMADAFFAVFGRHAPPSNGAPSPIRWGEEAHVRALFGPPVDLALSRRSYVERSPGGPREFCDFYKATFGPVVALYAALDDDATAALDADFLDFATSWARTGDGGHAEYDVEYLLVVGSVRSPAPA